MKKAIVILSLILGFSSAGGLFAQAPKTQVMTVNATVASRYKLELTSNSVTFTRTENPQTGPLISQNEGAISVTVKATTSRSGSLPKTYYLRIQATGNLTDSSSGNTISAGAVSWTATGSGFVSSGVLSSTSNQLLGSWNSSGSNSGTIKFSFQDNANYAPGTYRLTVTLSVGTT